MGLFESLHNAFFVVTYFLSGILSALVPKKRLILMYFPYGIAGESRYFLEQILKDLSSNEVSILVMLSGEAYEKMSKSSMELWRRMGVSIIRKNSLSHVLAMLSARIFITTHEYPSFSSLTTRDIFLWHGIPLKSIDVHFNNPSYTRFEAFLSRIRISMKSKRIYIVSPSRMHTISMLLTFGFSPNVNILEIGHPRFDLIRESISCSEVRRKRFFAYLSDTFKLPEEYFRNRRLVLYLPTFRDKPLQENVDLYLRSLRELADAVAPFDDLFVVTWPHPAISSVLASSGFFPKRFGNLLVIPISKDISFYDIAPISDVLITDYSSLFFEYLYLDKPIIFYVPDLEEYSKDRGFFLEPFDVWTPGPKVRTPDDILRVLEVLSSGTDPYACRRKVFREIFLTYADNDATEEILKIIKALI